MSMMTSLPLLLIFFAAARAATPPYSCSAADPQIQHLPFCNRTLPILSRARDLVSRLTLDEKIAQLVNTADAVPRLGVPAFQWWSEALHGVAGAGKGIHFDRGRIKAATSFPQVILSAASFDAYLWYRIGQVIGREARAVYNEGQAEGLTFWAPNINIFRDPRWGRGQETPGEDPLVTGKYAISYVRGVQGDSFQGGSLKGGSLLASACCKHFTAYDLERWNGIDRFQFNAQVTAQDMADTFQPPFQSCIQQARASGIMCAYNRVNGVPNCADHNLLTNVARQQWRFNGYITSDCDAVAVIYESHKYTKTPEDAAADVLKAGMDIDCGLYLKKHTKSAVQQKKLATSDIDRALRNLFAVRMRLGLFNGDPRNLPFGKIGPTEVCSQEHQNLALEAARHGIVLLKNDAKLLPLPKSNAISLAVIGPQANADNATTLQGNYYGPPCKSATPLQALKSYVKNIKYQNGCNDVACGYLDAGPALSLAKEVDYVVLVMGLDQGQEAESRDRYSLLLPGNQQKLIISVADIAKKPVVLVLLSGGPVDIIFAKNHPKIGGILWAGYPGEAGGTAIAEIIFGDHNPGGKLPVTWYPQDFVKVPMTDMRMRPVPSKGYPGRTYRFYRGRTVFPFGYGLGYSKHVYDFAHVSHNTIDLTRATEPSSLPLSNSSYIKVSELDAKICNDRKVLVKIGVQNQGEMASKHPVLLFIRPGEVADEDDPVKQLVGFETVRLEPGRRREVEYVVSPCEHMTRADANGAMVVDRGSHFFVVEDREYPISVVI
uniref:Fibronectin type III-like domain-containing protein n=1 Tax=Kalanchoe fedtschenkoi TaxID=63787 RepID=A0A7N0TKR8_KALFE